MQEQKILLFHSRAAQNFYFSSNVSSLITLMDLIWMGSLIIALFSPSKPN